MVDVSRLKFLFVLAKNVLLGILGAILIVVRFKGCISPREPGAKGNIKNYQPKNYTPEYIRLHSHNGRFIITGFPSLDKKIIR